MARCPTRPPTLLALLALLSLLACSALAGQARATNDPYRYDGRAAAYGLATVTLVSGRVSGGHVAVWSGVAAAGGVGRWLQGGVEEGPDGVPHRYVEFSVASGVHFVDLGVGSSLIVRLEAVSAGRWRLEARGRSWTVRIGPDPSPFAGAEAYDDHDPSLPLNRVQGRISFPGGRFGVSL